MTSHFYYIVGRKKSCEKFMKDPQLWSIKDLWDEPFTPLVELRCLNAEKKRFASDHNLRPDQVYAVEICTRQKLRPWQGPYAYWPGIVDLNCVNGLVNSKM